MKKVMLFSALLVLAGIAGAPRAKAMGEVLSPKETAGKLNNQVIERVIDGQKGFQEVAENAASPELKARFAALSLERGKFTEELKAKVRDLGEDPEQGGSASGAAHRAWIDVKSAVRTDDDQAVLGAVKMGEQAAVDAYREVLKENLPDDVRSLLQDQLKKIEASYDWAAERFLAEKDK